MKLQVTSDQMYRLQRMVDDHNSERRISKGHPFASINVVGHKAKPCSNGPKGSFDIIYSVELCDLSFSTESITVVGFVNFVKGELDVEELSGSGLSPEEIQSILDSGKNLCEHCDTGRSRKRTVLYRATDGMLHRVAVACLKKSKTPERYMVQSLDKLMYRVANRLPKADRTQPCFAITDFTTALIRVIKEHGWISSTDSYTLAVESTANRTRDYLWGEGVDEDDFLPEDRKDAELALRQFHAAKDLSQEQICQHFQCNEDFAEVLKKTIDIVASGFVSAGECGLAGIIGSMWHFQHNVKQFNVDELAEAYPIGTKGPFNLKFVRQKLFTSDWGYNIMYSFVDLNGIPFVRWTQGLTVEGEDEDQFPLERDIWYEVQGAVVEHSGKFNNVVIKRGSTTVKRLGTFLEWQRGKRKNKLL